MVTTLHVCRGRGDWKLTHAPCPWCWLKGTALPACLVAEVFQGYCGRDFVCGRCGYSWSSDDDNPTRKNVNVFDREQNIQSVKQAVARQRATTRRIQKRGPYQRRKPKGGSR